MVCVWSQLSRGDGIQTEGNKLNYIMYTVPGRAGRGLACGRPLENVRASHFGFPILCFSSSASPSCIQNRTKCPGCQSGSCKMRTRSIVFLPQTLCVDSYQLKVEAPAPGGGHLGSHALAACSTSDCPLRVTAQ